MAETQGKPVFCRNSVSISDEPRHRAGDLHHLHFRRHQVAFVEEALDARLRNQPSTSRTAGSSAAITRRRMNTAKVTSTSPAPATIREYW